jgi:hypothetical protein
MSMGEPKAPKGVFYQDPVDREPVGPKLNGPAEVEAAEDIADRLALAVARDEDDYVPWDEVKAELGLS